MSFVQVILALALSPFIAVVCFLIACAVAYIARVDRRTAYFSPETKAAQARLHAAAKRVES